MNTHRYFNRSNRFYPKLPQGEIIVLAPSTPTSPPGLSLISILLPLGGTILGLLIMVVVYSKIGTGGPFLLIMGVSSSTILISYLASFIQFMTHRKKYRQDLTDRENLYRQYLITTRNDLIKAQENQRVKLMGLDPTPQICTQMVKDLASNLWERSPKDNDFLCVRVGTGTKPLSLTLKLPQQDPTKPIDDLISVAKELDMFRNVSDCPILFSLRQAGIGGICGSRSEILDTFRSIIIQLATHHPPDAVKLGAIFPNDEYREWAWMRWLPHVWDEGKKKRYLACTPDESHHLMLALHEELKSRQRILNRQDLTPEKSLLFPTIVIILGDPVLLKTEPTRKILLNEGPSVGINMIFLADSINTLPVGCKAIISLDAENGVLTLPPDPTPVPFKTDKDRTTVESAEIFAHLIAPVRLEKPLQTIDIPSMVPLLDVMGYARVEEIPILSNWDNSTPFRTLKVPVGRKAGAEKIYLDLHEPAGVPTQDSGHGPHGLIAGMTGSGKSEFIQALVASLAVQYHPDDVAFVLFDFGLGATTAPLQGLPHIINSISNMELAQVPRALTSLNAEFFRRQSLFNDVNSKFGTNIQHIDDYMKLFKTRKIGERLPYLILIVDEFGVLKSQLPDEMVRFVQIATLGRKYGFRMILATQKPAGIVSDLIQSNAKFRICFKVQTPEDSKEVIKKVDAVYLPGSGRAYFQLGSGKDEIIEEFQSAFSNADYQPGFATSCVSQDVFEVSLNGIPIPIKASIPTPKNGISNLKQIQAVVEHIVKTSTKENIFRHKPIWLPPLPVSMPLEDVRPVRGWNGHSWEPVQEWLSPIIGKLDDPSQQLQEPLRIDFGNEGHLLVYGAPIVGKTTLLQTLILSLALDHSPDDINMYILDFGMGDLVKFYQQLPHVGDAVTPSDDERVRDMLRYLDQQVKSRKQEGAQIVRTENYNQRRPAIIVILDNYPSFKKYFPDSDYDKILASIAQEGSELDIHLVVSANAPSQLSPHFTKLFNIVLALQLPQGEAYSDVIAKSFQMKPEPYPGRGLVKGPYEFQTALPSKGEWEHQREKNLLEIVSSIQTQWTGKKAPRPGIPKRLSLSMFMKPGEVPGYPHKFPLEVPLGYDRENLSIFSIGLYPSQHFLITGALKKGKTTLLQTWLLAMSTYTSPDWLELHIVDFTTDQVLFDLKNLPHIKSFTRKENEEELSQVFSEIKIQLEERFEQKIIQKKQTTGRFPLLNFLSDYPAIILVISDYGLFARKAKPEMIQELLNLMCDYQELGFHVIMRVSSQDVISMYGDNVLKSWHEIPNGFILGLVEIGVLNKFNITGYMDSSKPQPSFPGDGFYVQDASPRSIRIASPLEGDPDLHAWVDQLVMQYKKNK